MKVAVVGAGVSGLVAAYLLHRDHDVTVFEAGDYAGGHVNTIPVDVESGRYEVDTGFIVFNEHNYPNFRRLLRRLGIGEQASDMSFSVSSRHDDFEYASQGANAIFAKRSHLVRPRFYRMLAEKVRFHREARRLLEQLGEGPTLGEFLDARRYSRTFIDRLIVPQVAAVWSAPEEEARAFPAKYLARFLDNHGLLQVGNHPQVVDGARRLGAVRRGDDQDLQAQGAPAGAGGVDHAATQDAVEIRQRNSEPETFDRVIVATHSDQALRMLSDATPRERELLSAFEYQTNEVALHTDSRVLPRRRRAWASWNYQVVDQAHGQQRGDVPHEPAAVDQLARAVLRHAQQPRGHRREQDRAPAALPAPGVHAPQRQRAGPARVRSRRQSHVFLRRILGLWVSRGWRGLRAARRRALRRRALVTRHSCIY